MTYRSVESRIRDVLEGLQPKDKLGKESDQNDQIAVGSYQTKMFDMSPDAQIIFADLPKETDANPAEQTAIHLDKLFDLHKGIIASQEVGPDYHPADDPRFHSPPSGNKPDPIAGPQGDRDVDNVKNYLIKRSKAAQRKLKLIDND